MFKILLISICRSIILKTTIIPEIKQLQQNIEFIILFLKYKGVWEDCRDCLWAFKSFKSLILVRWKKYYLCDNNEKMVFTYLYLSQTWLVCLGFKKGQKGYFSLKF